MRKSINPSGIKGLFGSILTGMATLLVSGCATINNDFRDVVEQRNEKGYEISVRKGIKLERWGVMFSEPKKYNFVFVKRLDGSFQVLDSFSSINGPVPYNLNIRDVNEDGLLDVTYRIKYSNGIEKCAVHYNNGDGSFGNRDLIKDEW